MKKRRVLRWLKVIVIIYCVVGIAIYFLQDYMILIPTPLPANYAYEFDLPFREVNLQDGKENINIIQFTTADPLPKGVILYFHGNRKNISRYRRFVPYFTKWGYEVWMID